MSLREIMLSEDWAISNLTYDKEFSKYHFKATHINGEVLEMSKTKEHVDEVIKELENEDK